jgi:hypothetical protein
MFPDHAMPIIPTIIQYPFSGMYALSRLSVKHQVSMTGSAVLKIQANVNGLSGQSQPRKAETEYPHQQANHLD